MEQVQKVLLAVVFVMLALMLYTAAQGGSVVANAGVGGNTDAAREYHYHKQRRCCSGAATYSKEELLEENAALKKEIEELHAKLVNYDQYRMENAQLRKYLELKDENRDFKPVPAAVIGGTQMSCTNLPLIRATNDGVSKNDPSLQMRVSWVLFLRYANYSQVTTCSHRMKSRL